MLSVYQVSAYAEKMSDLASYSQKDSPQRLKDENMSFCGGLTSQSHIEGGTGMSLFHMTYDISGGDSVGQEVAESMMTVLLPQALPLLKNPSTEKHKTTINPSSGSITGNTVHADSLGVRLQEEGNQLRHAQMMQLWVTVQLLRGFCCIFVGSDCKLLVKRAAAMVVEDIHAESDKKMQVRGIELCLVLIS